MDDCRGTISRLGSQWDSINYTCIYNYSQLHLQLPSTTSTTTLNYTHIYNYNYSQLQSTAMGSTNSQPQPTTGTARGAHWDSKPIHDPVTAPWNLHISQQDSQKMIHGFIPKEMEDKWLCYSTTLDHAQGITVIHLCRSWGKTEQIALKIQQAGAANHATGASQTWVILDITWERREGEQDLGEQEAKEDAIRVCNYILDCALPEEEAESYLPAT